ncbi:Imm50 family immunity protein [Streptomyces sp. SBR177]
MTAEPTLLNPEPLTSIYGRIPTFAGFRLRSINLNWRGPTVTLRLDLPQFPENITEEWKQSDANTIQCHLQFLAVANFLLSDWHPPIPSVLLDITPLEDQRRVKVEAIADGVNFSFTSTPSTLVGHVSAFRLQPDGSDTGRHLFVGKIDNLRYKNIPSPDEKTFHGRL